MFHMWRPDQVCAAPPLLSAPPPPLVDSQLMSSKYIMDECISQPLPSASIHLSSSRSIYSYSRSVLLQLCMCLPWCLGGLVRGLRWEEVSSWRAPREGCGRKFSLSANSLCFSTLLDEQHPMHPLERGCLVTRALTLRPLRPRHRHWTVFWLTLLIVCGLSPKMLQWRYTVVYIWTCYEKVSPQMILVLTFIGLLCLATCRVSCWTLQSALNRLAPDPLPHAFEGNSRLFLKLKKRFGN